MAEWYVIHASAGGENRVAAELTAQFEKAGLASSLLEVLVPKKSITCVRRGMKVQVDERIIPGYVFIRMECTADALYVIRRIPRVLGMLGADAQGTPRPLSDAEVGRLLQQLETMSEISSRPTSFEPGEIVKVSEGLFRTMEGTVEEVDLHRLRLKVSICILGRPTPVDLEFSQVSKIS